MPLQIERRGAQRSTITTDVLVVPAHCVEGDPAQVVNVSQEGVRLEMSAPVAVGQRVKLLMKGAENVWCSIPAVVLAVDETGVSCQFVRVDPSAQAILDSLFKLLNGVAPTTEVQTNVRAPWASARAELDPAMPVPEKRLQTPRPPPSVMNTPRPATREPRPAGGALHERLRRMFAR